jgi:hypothetical protein
MTSAEDLRKKLLQTAFRMPMKQTMMSRKSSITNAFVNAVIPVVPPTLEEIEHALAILEIDHDDVRCAYCGDPSNQWDHLRPLVLNRRPTGYISEIANLIPSCTGCNSSKRNQPWRDWMLSQVRLSPTGRKIADVSERIARIARYEQWRAPTKVDFSALVGQEAWDHYWSLCEKVIDELRQCQEVADGMEQKIGAALRKGQ